MIVFYLQKRPRGCTGSKAVARKFVGAVTMYDQSRSRAIKLGRLEDGGCKMIFKATVFDDRTTPPTIVRSDYGFGQLEQAGAVLPETYIETNGSIMRTVDGTVLMEGPK